MSFSTAFFVIGSVASTTSVVLVNKAVAVNYGFKFPLSLTGYHLFVSWLIMMLASWYGGLKPPVALSTTRYIIMAVSAAGSIVLTNFSLVLNSIGVYQVLKLANIPVIMLFQFFWFKRRFSSQVMFAIAVLVTGVGICTVTDVDFNVIGLIFGILGMISTAVNQAASQDSQQRLKVSSAQLLRKTLALQAFITIVCAFIFEVWLSKYDYDDPKSLMGHEFQSTEVFQILISALLGLCSNWFGQSLIGKTSAVTYQVVGHLKTLFTVVLGVFFFSRHVPTSDLMRQGVGIAMAWGGGVWYSRVKDDVHVGSVSASDLSGKHKHHEKGTSKWSWKSINDAISKPKRFWTFLFVTAFIMMLGASISIAHSLGAFEADRVVDGRGHIGSGVGGGAIETETEGLEKRYTASVDAAEAITSVINELLKKNPK